MKRCLVTGGAGFIGSHLVERLLKLGVRVTVIDDLSEGKWTNLPQHPNLKKYKASILDDVSGFVADNEIVFHLAAIPWPQMSILRPRLTHRVNVDGTLNLLCAARKYKTKKFIFSSSYLVYPKPLTPYSLQKLIGEQYCQLFSELWGLETVILRYFNVYGPRMKTDGPCASLIPRFIKLMSQNQRPTVNGNGEQTRYFTHVSDIVEANICAAGSRLSGATVNLTCGKAVSVNKVVDALNRLMEKDIKPIYKSARVEQQKAIRKINTVKLPNWKPKIKFEKGLKMMLSSADAQT